LKHAAIRECIEEAGVKCKNLIKLTSFVPDYEYTDNPTTIFLCKEFDFHNTELPITWLNMAQAKDLIRLGEINDSLTLIALYSLWERWRSKI
jgi:8-oxo-dGTP pyrophosphatase MutT (NUDIX family)